jgi:hypothetical protein
MRITDADPSKIISPLAPVLRGFLQSPAFAAPNRAEEIRELVAKHRIRLEVNDREVSTDFTVKKDRRIRTSLRGLEHLWGSLHAYLLLFDLAKANPGQVMDLLSSPGGQVAREFLIWAFGDPSVPWPQDLPRPSDTTNRMVVATNSLFLLSCGFILLHEIGHVVLRHLKQSATNPETKIRREYAADDWAAEFIVRGTDAAELQPRLTAIAATLGLIGGLELYGGPDDVRDHPFPPDRILHFLQNHVIPNTGDQGTISGCLLAAGVPIQAHLLKKGVGTMQPYQTFEEFFAAAKRLYPS